MILIGIAFGLFIMICPYLTYLLHCTISINMLHLLSFLIMNSSLLSVHIRTRDYGLVMLRVKKLNEAKQVRRRRHLHPGRVDFHF